MRILVVDDAAFMRMMLKNILVANGHEIVGEATNGSEAFLKYQELKPDLVTMDITMAEVDGIEGVKMIKGFDNNAKVIMCSAMGQQSLIVDSIKAGAIDFIIKPFKPERVMEAVAKAKK